MVTIGDACSARAVFHQQRSCKRGMKGSDLALADACGSLPAVNMGFRCRGTRHDVRSRQAHVCCAGQGMLLVAPFAELGFSFKVNTCRTAGHAFEDHIVGS